MSQMVEFILAIVILLGGIQGFVILVGSPYKIAAMYGASHATLNKIEKVMIILVGTFLMTFPFTFIWLTN